MQAVIALDLESTLVPEIWHSIAKSFSIDDLMLTTRDIPNYEDLMKHRLDLVSQHSLCLNDLLQVIETIDPLPGAKDFLDALRVDYQVVIISDTFRQFATPLMRKLGWPMIFCHELIVDEGGRINSYRLRMKDFKRHVVQAIQSVHYQVIAVGDSHNDLTMLKQANQGVLLCPPEDIAKAAGVAVVSDYQALRNFIDESANTLGKE